MVKQTNAAVARVSAPVVLKTYTAELPLGALVVGVDNIHHDVYLSPLWSEQTRAYLLGLIRQTANLTYTTENHQPRGTQDRSKTPTAAAWKKQTLELLQTSLTRAKFEKRIELDLLLRVALIKFLTQEIGAQFSTLLLEAKTWIRNRGEFFERSEQAHVMKSRLAEVQADRRNIYRQVGQHVYHILSDLEENHLARARHALFGEEQRGAYEMIANRIAFVEGGRDDTLFVEQYVLVGNYLNDQDRFETFDQLWLEFLGQEMLPGSQGGELGSLQSKLQSLAETAQETRAELARLVEERDASLRRLERGGGILARVGFAAGSEQLRAEVAELERRMAPLHIRLQRLDAEIEAAKGESQFATEEYQNRLGGYLNEPENARRLLDPACPGDTGADAVAARASRLERWLRGLEDGALLPHVLASYEMRSLYSDFCPPIHLQQLRKALVSREQFERMNTILGQFPTRHFPMERLEEMRKKMRKYPREEARAIALRFAEDFLRLRRDLHNHEGLTAAMERIQLVRSEQTRELSRLNNSLYEFLLPSEARPAQDQVVNHAVIKADVRGSTRITQELLARGLNPATLFSLNFYEPVTRILGRYSAAKVFIEGDAMVLAIFETESNRAHQRAVSKACALARQILAISASYNERPESSELPRLELGVGIAFQGSAPTYWVDSDSRIMISRALNLSDRLSSCSKVARRMLANQNSLFRLFVFQHGVAGAEEDEADEFLMRFNLNGVELNEEGFAKLNEEIALQPVEMQCDMPWGREATQFFFGEAPIGEGIEPILLRRGFVRQLLADGRIGPPGQRAYYEVCTDWRLFEQVESRLLAVARKD